MMVNELTRDELELGEKAKRAYFEGKSLDWIRDNCAVYLNTKPVEIGAYKGLNVTDFAVAGILAGIPVLVGGRYGSGKSQLASDIQNYYFGGAKLSGGESVRVDVSPNTDIMDPVNLVYTKFASEKDQNNLALPKIELTQNVQALFHFFDEINRTPTLKQNQFYGPLNGHITHQGIDAPLGRDGFLSIMATANLGNGLYTGTSDFDPALKNRFGIVLDTNYAMFRPTEEDSILINLLRDADPRIKRAPIRDISSKIITANRRIKKMSESLDFKEMAVLAYLGSGLGVCQKKGEKEGESWFEECRECPFNNNPNEKALCSLVGAPVPRTLDATRKYASALAYLANLKNPGVQLDGVDLMFKAFELTSAYQPFLNPDILQAHRGHSGGMMASIASRLKEDFRRNEKYIFASLEAAQKGREVRFCKPKTNKIEASLKKSNPSYKGGDVILEVQEGSSERLPKGLEDKFEEATPLNNSRAVGLSWVETQAKTILARQKALKEKKAQGEQ